MTQEANPIINNARRILKLLIDENAMVGKELQVKHIIERLAMTEDEYWPADHFLTGPHYIEATAGGAGGLRWLTANGIAYYEATAKDPKQAAISPDEELQTIIDRLSELPTRFVKGSDGLFLQTEDQAQFKQIILEATSLLDELLGYGNPYSQNVIHTVNSGSGGFFGGPSFAYVKEVQGILSAAQKQLARKGPTSSFGSNAQGLELYVSEARLEELKRLHTPNFDLARLFRLCEELNVAHANRCFMSIGFLVRAIVDHVPPIFGVPTFSQVANNYRGSKSFKAAMRHLDSSLRNAADLLLHVQIRTSEVLPSFQQVDFRADVDVLLGEVVRLLKMPAPATMSAQADDARSASRKVALRPIEDKWVTADYIEAAGVAKALKGQGYELVWVTANAEATKVNLERWEVVVEEQSDGTRFRFKVRDHPVTGGYLILCKKKVAEER